MADDPVVPESPLKTYPLPPQNYSIESESKVFNVTVRGWIAYSLVFTVCMMSVFKIDVKEPMYTLVVMAVSFYLGSKSTPTMPQQSKP